MSAKTSLNIEEKKIIGEVNQILFQNFKQFKKNYYNSLMKCAITLSNPEQYYTCTDAIANAQSKAQSNLKAQLIQFQKKYGQTLAKCDKFDQMCEQKARDDMRKGIYQIFNRFYTIGFN